ncbi:uncharacterized protein KQ657_002131 [Scheffersomyces spartinae]|uniref:Cns1/TTC4 wheel domain-containing protein n=1 Tax=Scheffersomyces spartinae TaxID=45513 RepID=A0A9P7VCT5_9ASCO|nr:uncharacterized protein KQ657_002131 [Scheffersomyces spartinae]KAG7195748.1 hypothetical protein KQ657_002131 [Scheffersomyces spartinae]
MTDEEQVTDAVISEWERRKYVPKPGESTLPPQLSELANKSTAEVMDELNRLPFFMTSLDETDGDGGENAELEALRSLAYDGEPDEIATNFKNQGNDCFKAKQYKNAIEYYTKGLDVACEVEEINKALLLNRAACNLELRNYRRCIEDCKKVLMTDDKNVKACYRLGKAFFAVERLPEAKEILQYGLLVEDDNQPMKELLAKIIEREQVIQQKQLQKEAQERERALRKSILDNAIQLRHYQIIKSKSPAQVLEDAHIRLEDPLDYESQLIFPAMILYPSTDEFDYVAETSELVTPNELLTMVLLDRPKEWHLKNLECYMETVTGGLIKVGKKLAINEALMSEKSKAPLFDNGLRLYVIPKQDSPLWISKWNKEIALSKRLFQSS